MTSNGGSGPGDPFEVLPARLRAIARRGVVRAYPRSTVLITEGEFGDTTFFLLRGQVRIYANDHHGREITYGTVAAGDYFAEMWLDGGPRSASVITLEGCLCALVGGREMRAHIAADGEFALDLLARVIRRARAATRTARDLALLDVYGRVVNALESHAGPAEPARPVLVAPVTHQGLASQVGASREMVSRLLKDLERGGYVALGVRQITLLRKLPARW